MPQSLQIRNGLSTIDDNNGSDLIESKHDPLIEFAKRRAYP